MTARNAVAEKSVAVESPETVKWTPVTIYGATKRFDAHKAVSIQTIGNVKFENVPVGTRALVVNFAASIHDVIMELKTLKVETAVSLCKAEYKRNQVLYDLGFTGTMQYTKATSQDATTWTLPLSVAWAVVQSIVFPGGDMVEAEELKPLDENVNPFASK